jgi:threonine synthase
MSDPGLVDRYAWRFGFEELGRAVGLGEGRAPLVSAELLLEATGYRGELYFHLEWVAPHGSFRDRGAAVAASAARRDGHAAIALGFADARSRAVVRAYLERAGLSVLEHTSAVETELERLDEASAAWRAGLATSAWDVFDQLGGRAPEHHWCSSEELALALGEGYGVLRREGSSASVPTIELARAAPSERAVAGLRRLGLPVTPERAAAVEAILAALQAGRFTAPAAVVLTLAE